MGFNDKFSSNLGEIFAQLMKLWFRKNDAKMRYGHIKFIYMIAVFLWCEGSIDKENNKTMMVELILYVGGASCHFFASDGLGVEDMRLLERMSGYGDSKW